MDDIENLKKRIDFNKTDAEVAIDLIEDATNKGDSIRSENRLIKNKAHQLFTDLSEKIKVIYTSEDIMPNLDFNNSCSVGIDGSFYAIGGVGGKWYSPYAVVRIIFENGINHEPNVDVYAAGIEEIREQEHINVNGEAARRMLIGETKAMEDWGEKAKESLIFIDGPVADPPSYNNEEYISYRSSSIRKCLKHSLLIGCVKRSRDSYFVNYYEKLLNRPNSILNDFPSDQHLFSYFFTHYRIKYNYDGFLFTNYIEVKDNTHRIYANHGVRVFSLFFQKDLNSKILRLDIPFLFLSDVDIETKIFNAVKATSDWQYPNQYIPLPVEIAHEKCKIREGAAETIYDEILTRTYSGEVEDIITMHQMR